MQKTKLYTFHACLSHMVKLQHINPHCKKLSFENHKLTNSLHIKTAFRYFLIYYVLDKYIYLYFF
jgi:hypothetical protein